jgi:hypothetical protein
MHYIDSIDKFSGVVSISLLRSMRRLWIFSLR